MVVVKGFGEEPMMLLTSLPVNGSFESMWRIVEGYLTRWRIEEGLKRAFTRFGKFCRKILDPAPDPEPAIIYQTLPGFEKFFNPDLC